MKPFQISIADEQIEDLKTRVRQTRWPGSIFQDGDEDGANLALVQRLATHWSDTFDWRAREAQLNELPQFTVDIDGQHIHFIHKKGVGPNARPLILTHGWPGSFVEFERVIPLLTDPGSHEGDPRDAFDVVVPSLPGFGFSAAPRQTGFNARRVAGLWQRLMLQLGYERYFAQGGDIGAGVTAWLGALYPGCVEGIHLNYIPGSFRPPLGAEYPAITSEEQQFLDRAATFASMEGAYSLLQATKPQTLSFSLSDSPVGLLGWIAEKFASWSDCDGDLETVISADVLLTNVSIYWFGNTIDSSLRMYKENRLRPFSFPDVSNVHVPMSFARFPKELPIPPRSWVERVFDVHRWTDMAKGGHFAALEQPELLVRDIQNSFRASGVSSHRTQL
ncbi:epoxide hydrolase family protein [Phyllobacterium sp. P30BS-XVII]|uniref:epoxide hydrolase family protein n=1 Tax=Phyllobacterium sp. P30BS-XVII TaxID=2587046 RepID=UPI000DD97850|nr:epoxide hydrolase family protein [Phyllobacterium sp. P30BS-XVII]MBA8903858.1 pimeloyl-ACP methyl ester carboxylesterase [Phyllobacterium sp. P30BS-XVII]